MPSTDAGYRPTGATFARFRALPEEERAAFYARALADNADWFRGRRDVQFCDWLVVFDFFEGWPAYRGRAGAEPPDVDRLLGSAWTLDRVPMVFGEGEALDKLREAIVKKAK